MRYGVNEAILWDFLKRDALEELAHTQDNRPLPYKVYSERFWAAHFPFWHWTDVMCILGSLQAQGCIKVHTDILGGQDCWIITLSQGFFDGENYELFNFNVMNYIVIIDQKFAVANGLTATEVMTLSAFITLTTWANKVTYNGEVWYVYTEAKMCEDFPLLFGCEKRVYKNISVLAEKGFVSLCRFDKRKLIRFTEKCASWGKEKSPKTDYIQSENGLESPKTDYKKSENGLIPPTTPNKEYILYNNQENNNQETIIPPIIPLKGESPRKSERADYRKMAKDFCDTIAEEGWREIVSEFLDYKCDIKAPLKCQKSLVAFLNNLKRDSGNDLERARGFLAKAIAKGWQSYHPDADKSLYEQKREAEQREKAEKAARQQEEWRAERERREKEEAERARQQEEAKAEYARKLAAAQEARRAYEAEEARRKAALEKYAKDNDLPF